MVGLLSPHCPANGGEGVVSSVLSIAHAAVQPPLDYDAGKGSANGYYSRMQHLDPFSAKCCWWMKHASDRMGFWILIGSTYGLKKVHIPFKKPDSPSAVCSKCLRGNNWWSLPWPYWFTLSPIEGLLFTVSVWTVTATTGLCAIGNAADGVNTALWGSYPFFSMVSCSIWTATTLVNG